MLLELPVQKVARGKHAVTSSLPYVVQLWARGLAGLLIVVVGYPAIRRRLKYHPCVHETDNMGVTHELNHVKLLRGPIT